MSTQIWEPTCVRPTGLIAPVRVDPTGATGPRWKAANGPRYQRVGAGLYVPLPKPDCVEQRILEAASRLSSDGSNGCLTGWASLRWRGARYFDGRRPDGRGWVPVEISMRGQAHRRPTPGIVWSRRYVGPDEWEPVDGLPLATVQRAVFDEICRRGSLIAGVQVVDMAAAARLISAWLFGVYAGQCNSRNGAPLVREVAAYAVDESRSPREVVLRLIWEIVAGFPRPLVNAPVYRLDGSLIGIPDLFDPESGTVGEYEGDYHRAQRGRDLVREEAFRSAGLEYFAAVGGESHRDVAARMAGARARALARSATSRQWTVERPAWDPAPETLDAYFERTGMVGQLTRM